MKHSFCETLTAGPVTPWHIRELTSKGKMLGGGADTSALCGRQVAWDINCKFDGILFAHYYKACVAQYERESKYIIE